MRIFGLGFGISGEESTVCSAVSQPKLEIPQAAMQEDALAIQVTVLLVASFPCSRTPYRLYVFRRTTLMTISGRSSTCEEQRVLLRRVSC